MCGAGRGDPLCHLFGAARWRGVVVAPRAAPRRSGGHPRLEHPDLVVGEPAGGRHADVARVPYHRDQPALRRVAGYDDGAGVAEARTRFPEVALVYTPDYATHIKPLFERSCVKCHGPEKRKSGLRLDQKRFALKGGESGPAIVPGDSAKSIVFTACSAPADDEDVMPPKGKLLALSEIELLKRWIDQGAAWPDDAK